MLRGRAIGLLLFIVYQCFREYVNFVFVLYSLDNFLLQNVFVFIFGNQISKSSSFEKVLFLTLFSQFLFARVKTEKCLRHISLLHTRILLNFWLFITFPILQNLQIYHGFSFVRLLVLILICTIFWADQQIGEQNLSWHVYYWYLFTIMQNCIHL